MSFPLSFLLIPYGLFLLFFGMMTLVYLYHLLRYSAASFGTYIFILFYAGVALVIINSTLPSLRAIDWSTPVNVTPQIPTIL